MSRGDELRAAIEAAPADDDLRRVYADWLLDQGDTRGELIHLQLADDAANAARIAALIAEHRAALLGPFARIAIAFEIRRGFLDSMTIAFAEVASVDRAAVTHLDRLEVTGSEDKDALALLTALQPRRELVFELDHHAEAVATHAHPGEPWDVDIRGTLEIQGFNIDNAIRPHPTIVRYVSR